MFIAPKIAPLFPARARALTPAIANTPRIPEVTPTRSVAIPATSSEKPVATTPKRSPQLSVLPMQTFRIDPGSVSGRMMCPPVISGPSIIPKLIIDAQKRAAPGSAP